MELTGSDVLCILKGVFELSKLLNLHELYAIGYWIKLAASKSQFD